MYKIFGKSFDDLADYTFPIAKIIFAISVLIASSERLRNLFYSMYSGSMPVKTQFRLDIFRFGNIPLPMGISLRPCNLHDRYDYLFYWNKFSQ